MTLYEGSIEDQAMEIEANHGHQGVGLCPRVAGNMDASLPVDRYQTVGLRRITDRCVIVAQSSCDRGPIIARSWLDRGAIVAHLRQNQDHDHFQLMGHDRRAIVAIKSLFQPDQTALKPMYSLVSS